MFEFQGQMVSGVLNGGLVPFTTYVCSVRAATNGGMGVLRTVSLSQLYKMVSHLAMILLLEECL